MVFRLRNRIVILALAVALLPMLVMSGLTLMQRNRLYRVLESEIRHTSENSLRYVATDFYKTCEITNNLLKEKVASNISMLLLLVESKGGLHLSPTARVQWDAVNQLSQEHRVVTLPQMVLGNIPIAKNYDPQQENLVLGGLSRSSGGGYTILQRMNEKGDMLRIMTDALDADGKRAVGSYIPAVAPDGTANPVVSAILRGENYVGISFAVNEWSVSGYQPLKDADGRVFACICSGVTINAMTMIKDIVRETRIGKSGYIAVLGGKGVNKGRYIIAHDAARENTSLLDQTDNQGRLFVQEIIAAGIKNAGEIGICNYNWKNIGDAKARQKMGAYIYFAPWDWLIMPTAYNDDYAESYRAVSSRINELLWSIVFGGLAFLVAALAIAWYLGNRIAG
ncbi:MAG: Cache 3/Cache 2 fusion domain-containing protein, partial [Victivallales bacterium]|nr:Cache 3/Cache 2 fusion domain-containing protein [Victivallales bacterium]